MKESMYVTSAFRATFACGLALAGFFAGSLAGCMGGSDGIENPKVRLELREVGGLASASGRIDIYSKNSNPMLDSLPLLSKEYSGDASVSLEPEEIDAALLKARLARGIRGDLPADTVIKFNVVAVSGDKEAFVSGFRYHRVASRSGFALAPWSDTSGARAYGAVTQKVTLRPAVTDYRGGIGGSGKQLGLDYVFVPGSPYHAEVAPVPGDTARAGFLLPRISSGSFALVGTDEDSAQFFEAADTLITTEKDYSATAWGGIIFIDNE